MIINVINVQNSFYKVDKTERVRENVHFLHPCIFSLNFTVKVNADAFNDREGRSSHQVKRAREQIVCKIILVLSNFVVNLRSLVKLLWGMNIKKCLEMG